MGIQIPFTEFSVWASEDGALVLGTGDLLLTQPFKTSANPSAPVKKQAAQIAQDLAKAIKAEGYEVGGIEIHDETGRVLASLPLTLVR